MSVKSINQNDLRKLWHDDGLIIQGCGGSLDEWVDGINRLLTEADILKNGSKFHDCVAFQHDGVTCLLFPFTDDVEVDIGKLALWRLDTHTQFSGTWLSDFVENKLGGFDSQNGMEVKKPNCPLIGQNGNIFNLMGIASRTLRENGLSEQATEMCKRIHESGSYDQALVIIGEYVNITSVDEDEELEMEMQP